MGLPSFQGLCGALLTPASHRRACHRARGLAIGLSLTRTTKGGAKRCMSKRPAQYVAHRVAAMSEATSWSGCGTNPNCCRARASTSVVSRGKGIRLGLVLHEAPEQSAPQRIRSRKARSGATAEGIFGACLGSRGRRFGLCTIEIKNDFTQSGLYGPIYRRIRMAQAGSCGNDARA